MGFSFGAFAPRTPSFVQTSPTILARVAEPLTVEVPHDVELGSRLGNPANRAVLMPGRSCCLRGPDVAFCFNLW